MTKFTPHKSRQYDPVSIVCSNKDIVLVTLNRTGDFISITCFLTAFDIWSELYFESFSVKAT